MAHKTLVNGTAYEISGGKTLVNGTAYSIDKGKTLVGGTAYEVGFTPPFTAIIDLGTITTMSMAGMHIANIPVTRLPDGWDTITHVMVNGILYEVTDGEMSNGVVYTFTDQSVGNKIQVTTIPQVTCYFNVAGPHTVQLGILA